jgi:hypothetical protein
MDLTTTPFDSNLLRKKCEFFTFEESGIHITMLSPINSEINSGHNYMFGTFKNNQFYWFFGGKSIAKSRQMMRDIYYEITENITDKDQVIFVFKGNIYGSRI